MLKSKHFGVQISDRVFSFNHSWHVHGKNCHSVLERISVKTEVKEKKWEMELLRSDFLNILLFSEGLSSLEDQLNVWLYFIEEYSEQWNFVIPVMIKVLSYSPEYERLP